MGKKETFDDVANQEVGAVDKQEEIKQTKEAFNLFRNEEIPKVVEAYDWKDHEVLVKIFKFAPITDTAVTLNAKGDTTDMHKVRYFSIAKVLAAGKEAEYEPGDLVKLKDVDTLSIENSKYRAWVDNPYKNGNMKKKGEEPVKYMSNIFKTLGNSAFILNPFALDIIDGGEDDAVYKLSTAKIENKIVNIDLLLK